MTDKLRERIKVMKQAADKVLTSDLKAGDWPGVRTLRRVFIEVEAEMVALCTPDTVAALIAEVERLERENTRLREAVKDAEDDARSAATETRWESSQGEDYGSY